MSTFVWTILEDPIAAGAMTRDPLADASVAGTSAAELARDLQLDANGDLLVEANDLVISRGAAAIMQDIAQRIRVLLGEWFLDLSLGRPYFQDIFRKNPNLPAFRADLRATVLAVPGVLEISELVLAIDRETRELSVNLGVRTDLGELRATSLPLLEM